ncbi:hypothetical protein [Helcobacillus massiliensis]|uniref:Uncharacterized protein n=1 Tax=Helcobacillus massiliensis TaxID=521392 RepID=A0A839QWW8_9MICO|nr:hypothetical protein [Helcobacillus massiliensis]MBB3023300.1 hypothetical protein [Helcobacillus massiliensis]
MDTMPTPHPTEAPGRLAPLRPESRHIDLPSEILAESPRAFVAQAPVGLYVTAALLGAFVWPLFIVGSLLAGFGGVFAGTAAIGTITRDHTGLGTFPSGFVTTVLLAGGLAALGAVVSAVMVPAGLLLVARVRPRAYGTEAAFQQAVAGRIAAVVLAPLLLTVPFLLLVPGRLGDAGWDYFAAHRPFLLMWMVVAGSCAYGLLRAAVPVPRLLGIQSVGALRTVALTDAARSDRARAILGVDDPRAAHVLAADLAHVDLHIGPQMPLRALEAVIRGAWVAALVVFPLMLMMEEPLLWIIAAGYDSSSDLVGYPLPLVLLAAVSLAGWVAASTAAYAGLLRLLPNRFAASWIAAAASVGLGGALLVALLVLRGPLGWSGRATLDALLTQPVVMVPLALLAFIAMGIVLHRQAVTVLVGPAHWYARRPVDFTAIVPPTGTRTQWAQRLDVQDAEHRTMARRALAQEERRIQKAARAEEQQMPSAPHVPAPAQDAVRQGAEQVRTRVDEMLPAARIRHGAPVQKQSTVRLPDFGRSAAAARPILRHRAEATSDRNGIPAGVDVLRDRGVGATGERARRLIGRLAGRAGRAGERRAGGAGRRVERW